MTMRLLICIALVLCAAPSAAAADEPPFPEYPAFHPSEGPAADQHIYSLVVFEFLEIAPLDDDLPGFLEGFWRLGDATDSFWLTAEAETLLCEGEGEVEAEALYSRLITAYFDAQAGIRVETEFDEDDFHARPQLAVGLEGLAPYWFELEPSIFVSLEGHVAARLEASYDLLITQRLVLQPEMELNLAVQEVEDWGVGSGLNDLDLGVRLRYEIIREVAPYVGVNWTRQFFDTADFARDEGEEVSETLLVARARIWW